MNFAKFLRAHFLTEHLRTTVAKEQKIEDNKKAVRIICKSFPHHASLKAIKEYNIKNLQL